MFETYHSSLIMLAKVICNKDITKLARIYRAYSVSSEKHHGRKFMVERMKSLSTIAERYTIHQHIDPLKFVKSDKNGFPDAFKAFKPYLRSKDFNTRIMVLSIFRSNELLRLAPHHDISSVITPSTCDKEVLESILNFIPGWIKSLNKKLSIPDMKYHYTVKKGPNGLALPSSDSDLTALDNDINLLSFVKVVSTELSDDFPIEDSFHRSNDLDPIHSKLTQFSEKAGKTRTIAVVDYYSQRALFPLHKGLMKLLNSLETDGTSSHMNVGKYVQELTYNKSYVRTFDLTAFTDRFPREIQETILKELVKEPLATAWWSILADRSFTVQWSGEKVKYATGQPMGAYASWPLCTLAHHAVVEYCRTKRQYRLIGDDVAIADKRSADLYQKTISALGVEVNPGKGTVSEEGNKFSSAEIAKRLYLNGIDVTPLTPGKILSLRNQYLCLEGIRDLKQRFDLPTLPRHIIEFHFPKGKRRDYIWCLACNPYNGVIEPSNEGYENNVWVEGSPDKVELMFNLIRMRNFSSKAMKLYNDGMPYGTYLSSWASLAAGYLDVQRFTGGTWQIPTVQLEAQVLARRELLVLLFKTLEQLSEIDPTIESDLEFLTAVECIPNPDDPFRDQKEVRVIHMSNLLYEFYLFVTEFGYDATTLQDSIEIPPYLSI